MEQPQPHHRMSSAISSISGHLFGLMLASACIVGCGVGETQRSVDRRPSDLCSPEAKSIVVTIPDSMSLADACKLVTVALQEVRSARPESGVARADSSAVNHALLLYITMEDVSSRAISRYWSISLGLAGRPYDAEVHVNDRGDSVILRRIHKPIR
jgi:hypothetical protein